MQSESVVFRGVKFRRYPESQRRSDRVYFTPGAWDKARGIGRLHEEIWKAAHGPIPDGHHVHHRDHDPLNNDLGNLECLPRRDHHRHHGASEATQARLHSPEQMEHLARIRDQASDWHRSPEGREWHREHGRRAMARRQPRPGVCDQCGAAFLSKTPGRFCSSRCKSAWRREAGLDNETRNCEYCGQAFVINRYKKTRFCSRSCAHRST